MGQTIEATRAAGGLGFIRSAIRSVEFAQTGAVLSEAAEDETEEQALWRLPRVVSVHKT